MPNNPYIEKVEKHNKILINTQEIYAHKWKWSDYFGNNNPIHLEIGPWMGNFFWREVVANPDINYIWIELRYKRLFTTAEKAWKWTWNNFIVIKDFGQHIDQIFKTWEITTTHIHFPDPWGKKDKQKKNRLLQADFLANLYNITKTEWNLIFKTDHREYFDTVIETLKIQNLWNNKVLSYDYETELSHFDTKSITEFEAYYRRFDTKICYLETEK